MILDVSGLASQQMRLARELDAALQEERAAKAAHDPADDLWSDPVRSSVRAQRRVAELKRLHEAALKAYHRACDEQMAEVRNAPPDQPSLFGSS